MQNTQDNNTQSAQEMMQKARSKLLLSHPFFGSLALKLELRSDSKCPNLWTDGKVLAYNPHFICTLSPEQVMGVQAHEILHLACGHHVRRKGRDKNIWNKACDLAINGLLDAAGFRMPSSYKIDLSYADRSVDAIYLELLRMYEQEAHGGAQKANIIEQTSEKQDATGGGIASSEGMEQTDQKQESSTTNHNDEQKKEKQKSSASGENQEDLKQAQKSSGDFFGEIKDHPLLDMDGDENRDEAELEAKINVSQAMQSSQHFGDIPQNLLRLYEEMLKPTLDWRILLERFIENCNEGDYTWSMPNRRYISQDIYLPARNEQRIMTIGLAVDCSGSIDTKLLSLFCTELESILEAYDSDLCIVYHDTKVQAHHIYRREDRPLNLKPKGGGGTDFRHIPNYFEKENIHPKCLLWFTDLECPYFPEEPPYPVLWVSGKESKKSPPFGEVVYIHEME